MRSDPSVDPHLANRFRQQRMRMFLDLVPSNGSVRILDLGGTADYWRALPGLYGRPSVQITILNLGAEEEQDQNLSVKAGDACDTGLRDGSFDIVHSNSVIEHVGDRDRMAAMAREVRRLGSGYFVQTPNLWFPIEPHYKLPIVHWLPGPLKQALTGDDPKRVRLISGREMQRLFPDSQIWREKYFGLTKSLVAIRR